ncbi:uncharacterized protein [Parasteatoda tepidariorum]|uniref:uncharacterized protein n=1 Tax=Parasteatoda tepidariorum TaxID=114398 RepID=UPI0039BCF867
MHKLNIVTLVKKNLRSSVTTRLRNISNQPERSAPRYRLRYMREQDIPQVKELRRVNGFYDAASCYKILLKIDPKCFMVAEDEKGKIISTICLKKITNDTYFACFHVTHENYRLQGIARQIIKHSFDSHPNCNIVGNSDIGLLKRNLKLPFHPQNDFLNIEYEYDTVIDYNLLSSEVPQNVYLHEYQDSYLGAILDYDRSVVGYEREQLVVSNCRDKDSRSFVATKGGTCVGYGTAKQTIQGCAKIGPLYAESPVIAEAILKNLLVSFDVKKGLAAQTFSTNFYANVIFGAIGTTRKNMLPSYRMYSKRKLMNETKNIYAVFDGEYEPF